MANRWQQQGGHPNGPVPAVRGKGGSRTAPKKKRPQPTGKGGPPSAPPPPPKPRILPVRVLQAFYEQMPPDGIQQFSLAGEAQYSSDAFGEGEEWTLYNTVIPELVVYVFTDIFFYAVAPSQGLGGIPMTVGTYGLSGSVTFVLRFSGRAPMLQSMQAVAAHPVGAAGAGAVAGAPTVYPNPLSGWGYLNEPFGAQRTSGFAVYARGREEVQFNLLPPNPTQLPRFPLNKFGVKLHGFAVPESIFDKLWQKFTA